MAESVHWVWGPRPYVVSSASFKTGARLDKTLEIYKIRTYEVWRVVLADPGFEIRGTDPGLRRDRRIVKEDSPQKFHSEQGVRDRWVPAVNVELAAAHDRCLLTNTKQFGKRAVKAKQVLQTCLLMQKKRGSTVQLVRKEVGVSGYCSCASWTWTVRSLPRSGAESTQCHVNGQHAKAFHPGIP